MFVLPGRLMVGHVPLKDVIGVRIPARQHMNEILSISVAFIAGICGAVIWHRRADIKSIGLDLPKGKAAIEFSPVDLKKVAKEIEEKEASVERSQQYRPKEFAAEIIQVGGKGSRLINKIAYSLEEHAYLNPDDFMGVSFNQAADIMWVSCKDDYEIVSCTTPESIFEDVIFPTKYIGMPIKEQLKNQITIQCRQPV